MSDMRLADLIHEVAPAEVVDVIRSSYNVAELALDEAVALLLQKLQSTAPDKDTLLRLNIEEYQTSEGPSWMVEGVGRPDPKRHRYPGDPLPETRGFDLSLTPWPVWLGLHVPAELLSKYGKTEIVAHCVQEMSFFGPDSEVLDASIAD